MLTLTTREAIANRLRGRLSVGGGQLPFGPSTVDDNLIEQVGEQVEARVFAKLRTIYKLPLTAVHPVLASIVEKLVVCDLMGVHFVGAEGSSADGFGRMMCDQGAKELEAILSGEVKLEGESPLETGDTATPFSSNLTIRRSRTSGAAEAIQW